MVESVEKNGNDTKESFDRNPTVFNRVDRIVRKTVPSTSILSYNPVFKYSGNFLSNIYAVLNPLTRGLPPNHMRVRVGVGNELFFNHSRYLISANQFWLGCLAKNYVALDSDIVDIGVGCGRYAHMLRDLDFYGSRFSGKYTGIDIDDEMLNWCKEHFDSERFHFLLSGHSSSSYKGEESGGNGICEIADGSQDLVFSRSLYSHLLEDELCEYSKEAHRVLREGKYMLMTYFSLTTPPPTYGKRHTFKFQQGIAHYESQKQPTAAVAYYDHELVELLQECGFSSVEFTTSKKQWQQMIIARK